MALWVPEWLRNGLGTPLRGSEGPSMKWIGNIDASYVTEAGYKYRFWWQLYVDKDGQRSARVTGDVPRYHPAEKHSLYSKIVYPWLSDGSHDLIWPNVDVYDGEFWANEGYVAKVREAPKPDFKLLSFPKNEGEACGDGSSDQNG